MKKFIILASLGIIVFSFAPRHTVIAQVGPPPPVPIVLPPPPIPIVLPPPPPIPVPLPPPPPPPPPTNGVPETSATWLLLLLGLAGTFGTLLIKQRSKKSSHCDS